MFSFFRRQKTCDSDKNGKGDKDKKDVKNKEKYTPGLSSPGTSAKRKDELGKEKSNTVEVLVEKILTKEDNVTSSVSEDATTGKIIVIDGDDSLAPTDPCETVLTTQTMFDSTAAVLTATTGSDDKPSSNLPRNWTPNLEKSVDIRGAVSMIAPQNESDLIPKSGETKDTTMSTTKSDVDVIAKGEVTISISDTGSDLISKTPPENNVMTTSDDTPTVIVSDDTPLKSCQIGSVPSPLSAWQPSPKNYLSSAVSEVVVKDDVTVTVTTPTTQYKTEINQSPPSPNTWTSTANSDVIVNGVSASKIESSATPSEIESPATPASWTFKALKSWNSASMASDQGTTTKNENTDVPSFSLVIPVQANTEQQVLDTEVHHKQTPLGLLTSTKINILSATPPLSEQSDKKVQIKSGWKKLEDVEKEKEIREIEKRTLMGQETRFQEQLAELKAQLTAKDTETNNLLYKMEELQRDVSVKSSGMDRLQAELEAAHKESQCVRQKLRLLENDVSDYRHKNVELSDELLKRSDEVAAEESSSSEKVAELEASVKEMEEKMKTLQTELEEIRVERDMLEEERAEMEAEREEEMKIVQEALEEVEDEKTEIQTRFEKDFEKLRSVNTDREQQLLNDFEWKLREVEQACKKRLEDKDKKAEEKIKAAQAEMSSKIQEAEKQLCEVQQLKKFEAEALQLRSMTHEQQKSLRLATRQTEQLQVSELILKDEVSELRSALDKEKKSLSALLITNEKRISDLDKKLHNRLDLQKSEINDQWEQRLKRECSRLKAELDHLHEEEKHLAIESLKIQKEQEAQVSKQSWEKRLQESLKEISTLKEQMVEKETRHQREMEKAQTNTDRDILELRRKLDKLDMTYQSQIEKLKENHEKDMEQLTWESGRKVQQLEQNWQLQTSSNRTTLELVKEQMERDSQARLEAVEDKHRIELEQQWEQLNQEKEEEVQQLEENHLKQLQILKEELAMSLKGCSARESDLVSANASLENQLSSSSTLISNLQGNADMLQGSVEVLNNQVINHGKEVLRVENQALEKLREREAELEAEKQLRLTELQKQHAEQAIQWQTQISATKEQINYLSKSLEETQALNESRPSRPEDLRRIADLQRALIERDKRLATASEELRLYELELLNRDTLFISQPVTGVLDPGQYMHGPKKKGGGKGSNPHNQPVSPAKQVQNVPIPASSPKTTKASASHSSRARSADYPAIKVLTKSPTRKAKKSSHASQSSTISTL